MINTKILGEALKNRGFDFYSGVPCSFLKDLINFAINDCQFIMAANEAHAVSICAGAFMGGKKSVFLCQNSGLTNASSPLTSLNYVFRIPVLGFVSLRGEEGIGDEPQHELMGKITGSFLDVMKIQWEYLSSDTQEALNQIERANAAIEKNQSFFFIVKKESFEKEKLNPQKSHSAPNLKKVLKTNEIQLPKRFELLEKISSLKDRETVFIASTGFTGRELCEAGDTPHNFYTVGSMGCASSIGLGLSLARPDINVIVLEGDGALLMQMGALATNAYYAPKNLLHVLLDNHAHESTGGQATVSANVNFVEIAAAAGYQKAVYAHNITEALKEITEWKQKKGLTFLAIEIALGTKENLGRPKVKPFEVKERLMNFLKK